MNENLPEAVSVIRTAMASVRPEQAVAIAHALDSARLLAGPDRFTGVVLRRAAEGGWSRAAHPATDLERQALAWDASCRRARSVAAAIGRDVGEHPAVRSIRADGDRVCVVLRLTGPAQWAQWRSYFGITTVGERPRPHLVAGEGRHAGVRVSVLAHEATRLPHWATGADTPRERRPFKLGGITYDLVFPYRDVHGDLWYFQGLRDRDGMPMLSLDGRPERCSLANVVSYAGPLTPVPDAVPRAGRIR